MHLEFRVNIEIFYERFMRRDVNTTNRQADSLMARKVQAGMQNDGPFLDNSEEERWEVV